MTIDRVDLGNIHQRIGILLVPLDRRRPVLSEMPHFMFNHSAQ